MMERDGCVGCKYEHEDSDSQYCIGCKQNAIDKYKRMTNADKIRSMSDAELFNFLKDSDFCLAKNNELDCSSFETCNECHNLLKTWLQSESEK